MIKKIFEGLLFGIGLSVAILIVGTLSMKYIVKQMYQETLTASEDYFSFNMAPQDDPNLSIEKHDLRKEGELVNIYGTVTNSGENIWSSLNIQVEFFDKKGKFVHECEEYLLGKLGPNDSENFVVSCGGCKKNPIPQFHNYKISIESGFANMPGTRT